MNFRILIGTWRVLCGLAVLTMLALASGIARAEHVRVFLLGGQSNMLGRAPSSGLPTSPVNLQLPQDDVRFYFGSALTTLRPGSGRFTTEFGPEVSFGRAIADASPLSNYALIKYAAGGTSLYEDWAPGTGAEYTAFQNTVSAGLAALQAAGHTTEIVGMLWHQGENDAIEGQQAIYQNNLTAFIADVRNRYGADLPFFIGEIRRSNGPAFVTVADAQVAVAAADPNAAFIPASDLSFLDAYHFDAASQVTLGNRFAASYIQEFRDRQRLSAGGYHVVCTKGGGVVGLGDGTYGQLGVNPLGSPAIVAGISGVTDVAAGGFSTLALKSDGTVWFLGETTMPHTTPHGTPNAVSTPVQIAGLSGIDHIAAGHRHFLALDAGTGNLYAWGHNGSGQVGNGGLKDVTTPVVVLTGVSSMSAGDGFSLAVKSDKTLWVWGRNTHGQLGLGDTNDRLIPTQVAGVTSAASVAAGGQHALIRLTSGSVLATGNNTFGQLGLGNTTTVTTPTAISGLTAVMEISAGHFHSAAFGTGNEVRVWGRNYEGQCGGGGTSPVIYNSPQILAGISVPIAVICGYHFTLVKLNDGSIMGTGSNADGQFDGSSVADQSNSRKVLTPQLTSLVLDSDAISPPLIQSRSPANGSTGASVSTQLVLTFQETIQKGTGSIVIKQKLNNQIVASVNIASSSVTVSSRSATIVLPSPLANGTHYYIECAAGAFIDLGANPFAGIAGSSTWGFATAVATPSSPITLANFSFQSNVNPDATGRFSFGESRDFGANGATDTVQAGDDNNITSWTTVATENSNVNGAELAVGFSNITPANGTQVLSLQSGASTRQFTGTAWNTLTVGDQITMTVAIGDRTTGTTWADESFFALIDAATTGTLAAGTLRSSSVAHSGSLVTPFSGGLGIDGGTMQDRSFTHTVVAADLLRSGNIGVLLAAYGTTTDASGGLGASANQAFFDNVRLHRQTTSAGNFDSYISNPAFGIAPGQQGFALDPDGDGLSNGLEAWLGTHPGTFSAGLTNIVTNGTVTTFTHPQNETLPSDVSGQYEWSPNLTDWYSGDGVDGPQGGPTIYVVPVTLGATTTVTATANQNVQRLFLRVRALWN